MTPHRLTRLTPYGKPPTLREVDDGNGGSDREQPAGDPGAILQGDAPHEEAAKAAAPSRTRIDRQAEDNVLACLRRDQPEEALQILMKVYGPAITGFVFRMLRNREAAEDVRQQVFLEAFQGITNFQGRSSCYTWLTKIAYHRSLDAIKRRRRIEASDDFDVLNALHWQPDPSMDAGAAAKRRALEHCLGKLPAAIRVELLMRLYFDLSYAEIEKISGAAAGTIQMRVNRILPKLRQCLQAKGVWP